MLVHLLFSANNRCGETNNLSMRRPINMLFDFACDMRLNAPQILYWLQLQASQGEGSTSSVTEMEALKHGE